MISFDQFIAKYNGKPIDYDGYYGYQCMDLYRQYVDECLGYPQSAPGNAIDVYTKFTQTEYYDKIANGPTNFPLKGDVVVWGTGVGSNGHIAVCISADGMRFKSFDQNWPVGSYCHSQDHNYNYVLGWLHPKKTPPVPVDYKALYEAEKAKTDAIKKIVC